MPYLTIYTNVKLDSAAEIAEQASALTADILNKPQDYVITNIIFNPAMAFGGSSNNKGALIELKSIGLGNKNKFIAEMTDLVAQKLNISNKQYIAIGLIDMPAAYTACAGRAFA
ncbi:MAG: hypothetical protein IJ864_01795 [Alphaproteobacteria bacterium]|nr:hypothetical protein [Alphaproteobacteria bacterium]